MSQEVREQGESFSLRSTMGVGRIFFHGGQQWLFQRTTKTIFSREPNSGDISFQQLETKINVNRKIPNYKIPGARPLLTPAVHRGSKSAGSMRENDRQYNLHILPSRLIVTEHFDDFKRAGAGAWTALTAFSLCCNFS